MFSTRRILISFAKDSRFRTQWVIPFNMCTVDGVSTFFHPANRPIYFVKSFYFYFCINSVRVRVRVMSQSIPWVPIPPRAFVGHLSFWRKNVANAPPWGPNNATKSPPLGTYIDTNAPPLGTKYKFSEDF